MAGYEAEIPIERRAHIILGHGSERIDVPRDKVPPGCLFIVSEECGVLGTLPDYIYQVIADASKKDLFENPDAPGNLAKLEKLFRKPLKLYKPGMEYPKLSYYLFNDDRNPSENPRKPKEVEVYLSGVQQIPILDGRESINPGRPFPGNIKRTVFSKELPPNLVMKMYEESIFPSEEAVRTKVSERIQVITNSYPNTPREQITVDVGDINVFEFTQAELFSNKGIYFMFLCRDIKSQKSAVLQKLKSTFPGEPLPKNSGEYNIPGTLLEWITARRRREPALSARQAATLNTLEASLKRPLKQRRASVTQATTIKLNPAEKRFFRLIRLNKNSLNVLQPELSESLGSIDPNVVEPQTGYTPLMLAAQEGHFDLVKRLVGSGRVAINARSHDGSTALTEAADALQEDIAIYLLENGADPTIPLEDGTTVLHLAAAGNLVELLKRVLPAINPRTQTIHGYTPLHAAAEYDQVDAAEELVSADPELSTIRDKDGYTPFHFACKHNAVDVATFLLEKGYPVNQLTDDGKTGILIAIENGSGEDEEVEPIFDILLDAGASLEDPRLVSTAIEKYMVPVLLWLLEKGAVVADPAAVEESLKDAGETEALAAFRARLAGGRRHRKQRRRTARRQSYYRPCRGGLTEAPHGSAVITAQGCNNRTLRLHRRGRKTRGRRS